MAIDFKVVIVYCLQAIKMKISLQSIYNKYQYVISVIKSINTKTV